MSDQEVQVKLSFSALLLAACASHTPPVPDASTEEPPRAGAPPVEADGGEAWSPCEASRDVLTRIPLPCKPYDVRTDLGRPLPW